MLRYFALFRICLKKDWKRITSYGRAFTAYTISQMLYYGVTFFLLVIMLDNFESMDGWSIDELMLLYATNLLTYSISGSFFQKTAFGLSEQIRIGEFDDALLKPYKLIPYLCCKNFMLNYIPNFILTIIVIAVCFVRMNMENPAVYILVYICVLFIGVLAYSGMFLLLAALTFYTVKNDAFRKIWSFFRDAANYPLSIFPRGIQLIMTFLIPFAIVNYYPIQMLLPDKGMLGLPDSFVLCTPFMALGYFILSVVLFNLAVKKYTSTGS